MPACNPIYLCWGSSLASHASKLVILGGTVNRHMSAGSGPPERADLIIRMASSCTCLNNETSSVSSSGEEAFNRVFCAVLGVMERQGAIHSQHQCKNGD